jgi:hypothetical protein
MPRAKPSSSSWRPWRRGLRQAGQRSHPEKNHRGAGAAWSNLGGLSLVPMRRRPSLAGTLALGAGRMRLQAARQPVLRRSSGSRASPQPGGPPAIELRRNLAATVRVLAEEEPLTQAQGGAGAAAGTTREDGGGRPQRPRARCGKFQLRIRVRFNLRTRRGSSSWHPRTSSSSATSASTESTVLAKEAEDRPARPRYAV